MTEPKQEYVFKTVLVEAPPDSPLPTAADERQAVTDEIEALRGEAEAREAIIDGLLLTNASQRATIANLHRIIGRLAGKIRKQG